MERSTKIYLGVGAAALIAFFILRNKAAAQKPTTATTPTTPTTPATPAGGGTASKETPCPAGQTRVQLECIVAPCGSMCMPDVVDHPAPPVFVDDIMPAPLPAPAPTYPTYPKFPVGGGTMIYDGGVPKIGNQELYL
jgi:hypothetical protein